MATCNKAMLVLVLFLDAVACRGQNKPDPAFDADDTSTHAAEVVEALKLICPRSEIARAPNANPTGCRDCPAGTAFQDEHGLEWHLSRAVFGHFTSPHEDNIILSARGCEPHSMNFGGSFVFLLERGQPRPLKYNQSLITERCRRLHFRDSRDFLVCQSAWGVQGVSWSFVYSVAFDQHGKSEITRVFETEDSVGTCGEDDEGRPHGPVQRSAITAVKFRDLDGGGLSGLSITATLGRKQLTEAEREACDRALKNLNHQEIPALIATKEYQIDFLFDGREFKVAPASKGTLRLFPKTEFPP